MDQHQQQHQHHSMAEDHPQMPGGPYFYPQEDGPYNLAYNTTQMYNPVAQHATQTRQMELHQAGMQQYHNTIALIPPHQYQANVFPGSPPHGSLPVTGSPAPPSPDLMYDHPLSPPVSGSDTSADGLYHHSNSSGANSPASSRANSLVHRSARYNPTPSPTSSVGRRRSRSHDSDDDDNNMGVAFVENLAHTRKEATRRQRIEAEQRRRNELRDGYAKLKDVLPVSNEKSSKVSLLDRATNHIIALERSRKELEERIAALEAEMQRLRGVNEKICLSTNNTPSPSNAANRPLSPHPLEGQSVPAHSLTSVKGQQPPSEHSSPSASDNGF
ncbi:hypothetical protein FA15DRAFT_702559 [Coprinopsis marcescibilis]|uniref:BHLH domain-containing protein n=1 Tax=Coprinopsis marcescibilis TaxID=230819 RepID=A0A5C3L249_COPMA|nr:hypothetical protein FA15DRAFT_702559 [Coprinopsis marcescibilis]